MVLTESGAAMVDMVLYRCVGVYGLGCSVGFRVWGLGFRVQVGEMAYGSGFGVVL